MRRCDRPAHAQIRASAPYNRLQHAFGERDPIFPIEHGRRLVQLIPSAEALWLPDAGHVVLYPPRPSVTRTIVDHLMKAAEGKLA